MFSDTFMRRQSRRPRTITRLLASLLGAGIVNVVMASAALLKEHPQAVLLSSYLSAAQAKNLFRETADFYERLICMDAHTASVLLG